MRETHQRCIIHGAFGLEKYGSGKRGARTGRTSPEKRHKKAPGEGGEHDEAGTDEAGAGGNADSLTEPGAPRPDHGAVKGRGAGNEGSSRAHRAPGSESGRRIALPRLRRSTLRSAAGDGRCSYTPAPSRALYGLVARLTQCAYLILPENGHRNREYFTPPPIRGGGEYSHVLIIMPCCASVNPGAGAGIDYACILSRGVISCRWRASAKALQGNGRRLAPVLTGAASCPLMKGGLSMSTDEVLELCLVIIGICNLFIQAYKKK